MPEKELSLQKVLGEHSGEEMSQEALDLMATSLYDAALYAETGISERHESETFPEYVDAGMEAVLSEEKDLKIEIQQSCLFILKPISMEMKSLSAPFTGKKPVRKREAFLSKPRRKRKRTLRWRLSMRRTLRLQPEKPK